MNRECPTYFAENPSTNSEERIKEEERIQEDRLKNYFMFKSPIPQFYSPKREQKIGRAMRLTGKNMSK